MNAFQRQAMFERECYRMAGEFIYGLWCKLKMKWRLWRLKRRGLGESPMAHLAEVNATLQEFHAMRMDRLREGSMWFHNAPLPYIDMMGNTEAVDEWPEIIE